MKTYIPGQEITLLPQFCDAGEDGKGYIVVEDSGQNKLPPSKDRWKLRSRTYPGVARAFASAWASKLS